MSSSKDGHLEPQLSLSNALGSGDSDSEIMCPIVPTKYINSYDASYFMQDILERSGSAADSNVFFEENSFAFTLVPPVTAVNYSEAPSDPEGAGLWATVWYSNQPFHAAPAAVSAFANIQLKYFLGEVGVTDNLDNFGIEVTNFPLPRTPTERVRISSFSLTFIFIWLLLD